MELFVTIISILIGAGIIVAVSYMIKKRISVGLESERKQAMDRLTELNKQLERYANAGITRVSKQVAMDIREKLGVLEAELESLQNKTDSVIKKLSSAHQEVQDKEAKQNELKTVKAEEEQEIEELHIRYKALADESRQLEKELQDSLQQIETLRSEVELTQEQKEALNTLQEVLEASTERMKELITEYETIKERFDDLRRQYMELEEEYTRLVEQHVAVE